MSLNFRNEARKALAKAKTELSSSDDDRLRYAALELRLALESITYDKMSSYKDEIPPEEYDTWQPKKVLQLIVSIHPSAQLDSTISYGVEEEYGVPAPVMQSLGTEKVLTVSDLKEHYDAIGSHLHTPTLKQLKNGKVSDPAKLRPRCQDIVTILEKILSSTIHNANFGSFATVACFRCTKPIRRRVPHSFSEPISVKCFHCNAEHKITDADAGKVLWSPTMTEIMCNTQDCGQTIALWPDEIKPGTCWQCKKCNERFIIQLGISKDNGENNDGKAS